MDTKQIAELSKFIGTIASPKIGPFIDLKKLCQSGIYGLAVQMGAEHAFRHGDFGYLNTLFGLLDGTQYGNSLIASLRPKLTFVILNTKPRKFKKATAAQVADAAKKELAMPIMVKTNEVKALLKKNKEHVSHDIMDSRLMLPGSYGAGKRR
jgi:hypothetical protein